MRKTASKNTVERLTAQAVGLAMMLRSAVDSGNFKSAVQYINELGNVTSELTLKLLNSPNQSSIAAQVERLRVEPKPKRSRTKTTNTPV